MAKNSVEHYVMAAAPHVAALNKLLEQAWKEDIAILPSVFGYVPERPLQSHLSLTWVYVQPSRPLGDSDKVAKDGLS
jgi:hypothetical protein